MTSVHEINAMEIDELEDILKAIMEVRDARRKETPYDTLKRRMQQNGTTSCAILILICALEAGQIFAMYSDNGKFAFYILPAFSFSIALFLAILQFCMVLKIDQYAIQSQTCPKN